jgi:hypothetical protein
MKYRNEKGKIPRVGTLCTDSSSKRNYGSGMRVVMLTKVLMIQFGGIRWSR